MHAGICFLHERFSIVWTRSELANCINELQECKVYRNQNVQLITFSLIYGLYCAWHHWCISSQPASMNPSCFLSWFISYCLIVIYAHFEIFSSCFSFFWPSLNFFPWRAVYEELGKYGTIENQVLCRERVEELEPSIRYCLHKVGESKLQTSELLDIGEMEGPALDLFKSKLEVDLFLLLLLLEFCICFFFFFTHLFL